MTYLEVACVRKEAGWLEASPSFGLARAIGELYGPNDGMVTYQSACPASRKAIDEWSADHGAIGWPFGLWRLQRNGRRLSPANSTCNVIGHWRHGSLAELSGSLMLDFGWHG